MATQPEPEIILYDLACTKGVCFSPVVWKIRLMLNYKRVPYKTVFLEFPDVEPTLKGLGLVPPESVSGSNPKYTVPSILHIPTNTYMMDSVPISQFIESTYPDPRVPLTSELGREIETKARTVVGPAFRNSLLPREVNILSPRAGDYFRRAREADLGHPIEELLDHGKEGQSWRAVDAAMRAVGELMLTHKADGPFILGARPSYTDFFVAATLQCARVVDEGVFQRIASYPGFGDIYKACLPYMERQN